MATKTSVSSGSGAWTSGSSWVGGVAPVNGTDVGVISAGFTVSSVPIGATCSTNYGTITNNYGTIVTNAVGGIVADSDAQIGTNNGTIIYTGGSVTYNAGTITDNGGRVTTNAGTVTNNSGHLETNTGTVTNNTGSISSGLYGGVGSTVYGGFVPTTYADLLDDEPLPPAFAAAFEPIAIFVRDSSGNLIAPASIVVVPYRNGVLDTYSSAGWQTTASGVCQLTADFTAAGPAVGDRLELYVEVTDSSGNVAARWYRSALSAEAAIKAKTDMLGASVTVTSFVIGDGNMLIIRGNDHNAADGRQWDFTDPGTWPALAAASIELSMRKIGNNSDPAPLILTGSVLAGPPQIARFQATAAQTVALAPSLADNDYTFDVVATLADGHKVTIIPEGLATVVCNVTGTGLPVGQPSPVSIPLAIY